MNQPPNVAECIVVRDVSYISDLHPFVCCLLLSSLSSADFYLPVIPFPPGVSVFLSMYTIAGAFLARYQLDMEEGDVLF